MHAGPGFASIPTRHVYGKERRGMENEGHRVIPLPVREQARRVGHYAGGLCAAIRQLNRRKKNGQVFP